MIPIICPKCRAQNWVGKDAYGHFVTRIVCSHYSANMQAYYREESLREWALRKLKETNEAIRDAERRIIYGDGQAVAPGLSSLGPDLNSFLDPVWNCRCVDESTIRNTPITGLGYAVVPHPKTSGVRGFLYGFKLD